jgi:hypothetical protein
LTGDLAKRRDRLSKEFARLQYDLGGLAYEMAIRNHMRLDVLARQAARLQEIDAELGEIERLSNLEDNAAGGSCSHCGALHGRQSFYCWKCGSPLMSETEAKGDTTTVTTDLLQQDLPPS